MRQWTLAELVALSHQETRPTDPEELRAWKIVRHPIHYGTRGGYQGEGHTPEEVRRLDEIGRMGGGS